MSIAVHRNQLQFHSVQGEKYNRFLYNETKVPADCEVISVYFGDNRVAEYKRIDWRSNQFLITKESAVQFPKLINTTIIANDLMMNAPANTGFGIEFD